VDGDIGGFLILRGKGETTLLGGERPGRGWMEWRDGGWEECWFWGGGKAGRVRASERRGELLLFVTFEFEIK